MNRTVQILVTVLFVAVLTVPGLLLVLGVRPGNLENRAIAEFPEVDASSVVDDDDYVAFAAYLTDRLPFRDEAIKVDSRIEKAITLSDPLRTGVPRGRDGWLYHADTLIEKCPGPPVEQFLSSGGDVATLAEEAGIPFTFLVAPEKVSIYPDHLPLEGLAGLLGLPSETTPECNESWDEALGAAAPSRPWLDPLADDLRSDLESSDDALFYRADTHWTDAGSINQVEAMVTSIDPELWDPAAVKPTVPDVKNNADAAVLRGETIREEVPGLVIERPGVTVEYDRAPPNEEKERVDVSRATSTGAPLIEGTTVLLGDSFGRHAMELMGPYFEELIWVNRDYLLAQGGFEGAIDERPSAIFVEQVQRNLAKGWFRDYLDPARDYLKSLPQR